jgi:hypothetical protein
MNSSRPPRTASPRVEYPKAGYVTARTAATAKGKRSSKIFIPENAPSSEEVGILKREKHNLIQEKSLLKAKITRLIDITKHPNRYSARQNTDQNSLEREYRQVEQLSAYKRAEIASLNASDLAAIVNELQEECLMLHMELIRVKSEKNKTDQELKQVSKQLQEAKAQFHPDLERKQKRIIHELEKQISEQKIRNGKIKAKLEDKENEMLDNKQDEASLIIQKTIQDLEQKIRNEQDEIQRIEEEMKQMDEEKNKEINDLQQQLSSL